MTELTTTTPDPATSLSDWETKRAEHERRSAELRPRNKITVRAGRHRLDRDRLWISGSSAGCRRAVVGSSRREGVARLERRPDNGGEIYAATAWGSWSK